MGDNPMTGDWNGDGVTETGIFRAGGHWYLDMNNNGTWDSAPTDKEFYWGKTPGDIPITGDWNRDGIIRCYKSIRTIFHQLGENQDG
jgi:hypothetical protein